LSHAAIWSKRFGGNIMSQQKITKVSEKQRGEWTETKWSDGQVTLHRDIKPSLNSSEAIQVAAQ